MHIHQLQLVTPDLDVMQTFYADTLGLCVERQTDRLRIAAGGSDLVFKQGEMPETGRYHIAFNIPENQLADACDWLTQRVDLLYEPANGPIYDFRDWRAHAVYFSDWPETCSS